MKIIVQKYGGSSLATPELIQKIADRVIATKKAGYQVVVVVSALGDTTDHLVELARQVSSSPPPREMDMLLSVGERISIALLAMAIHERGHAAISFTGSQVGIITNTDHTRARILEIKGDRIRKELNAGKIVVIAGYQGVSINKEITTLGRGGSDTTAVALAAALDAERCDIMTDVDGVYTAKPQWVPEASRLSEIDYDEMLEMADTGAQVLKTAAVEFAKRHNVKIAVGSSFTGEIGTIVCNNTLDQNRVTGISHDEKIVLVNLAVQSNGKYSNLLNNLAGEGVPVKFIWQVGDRISLLVSADDLAEIQAQLSKHELMAEFDHSLGLLAVTGVGINFGTDIMAKANGVFAELKMQPKIWSFSETRLCYGITKAALKEAVKKIHAALID